MNAFELHFTLQLGKADSLSYSSTCQLVLVNTSITLTFG